MKSRSQRGWWIVVAAALVGVPARAQAWDFYVGQNPLRKLGRGVASVVTGPLELGAAIEEIWAVDGPIAGWTVGTVCGIAGSLIRMASGVVEIATFPAPLPGIGYGPIVEPEFLLHPDDHYTLDLTLTR